MINIMYAVDPIKRIVKPMSVHAIAEQDHEASSLRFAFPDNIAGTGLESTGTAVRVMYIRPNGGDPVAKTLTFYKHSGGYYLYDWTLQKSDLSKEGALVFSLCILDISGGEVSEWHTTPCQIRVLDTIHTDDSDEGDETITPTVAQRVAVLETMIQRVASGAPIVVASTSAMTDTNQIYVLSTNGRWYYHNGTAWASGGEYGAVATDSTLTQTGVPADAEAVGDRLRPIEIKSNDLDTQINGSEARTEDVTSSAVWTNGQSINSNDGTSVTTSTDYSWASIDISGATHVSGYTRAGQDHAQGLAMMTSNGVRVFGDYHVGAGTYDWNYSFDVPENATELRISCATLRINQFTCSITFGGSSGIVTKIATLESTVKENTGDIADLVASSVAFGNVGECTWKDGYRPNSSGKDVVESGYSYAIIDVKALQGCMLSGYTKCNNDYPAFAFLDENGRIIGTNYNPSQTQYDYNYNVIVPNGAAYAKVSCSTARKADFTVNTSALPLLDCLRNTIDVVPQNYRASESVQALKGHKADFDALSQTRLQDVYDWYDNLVSFFPSRITKTQIGTSTTPTGAYAQTNPDTYPIYAYVWTGKNAKQENKFILAGGLHGPVDTGGDGIQGVIAMAYFVEDLLFHPDKNDLMRKIYDECVVVMIPVLNPWGYQTGYRCNGNGVDCNRNFDFNWVDGESYGYSCGTAPFSENETAALRDYINANHLDAKFFCEIHTRGGAVLPDDVRWVIVLNTDGTYTGLLDLLKTTGAEMVECYGGTTGWLTHTVSTAEPTCYSYFDYVKHIPTYEPEFFRSCNRDDDTLDSRGVQIQCTSWMGSMVQTLAEHFCTFGT